MTQALGPHPADASQKGPDPLLRDLERYVAAPGGKRDVYRATRSRRAMVPFSGGDVERAQRVHPKLWEVGGSGVRFAEEELLDRLARAADPRTVPFWLATIELGRVGDGYAFERRETAVAALAFLAVMARDAPAQRALASLLRHRLPEVRARAAEGLAHTYFVQSLDPSSEDAEALADLAAHDRNFEVRFAARRGLRMLGLPVPRDVPEGVFRFEVTARWAPGLLRTIELRSDQTLHDLSSAILNSLGWDHEHLFAFYLTGDLRDLRHMVPEDEFDVVDALATGLSAGGEAFPDLSSLVARFAAPGTPEPEVLSDDDDTHDEEAESTEDEAHGPEASSLTLPLGELGLVARQKFIYRYDFGDDHRFNVKLVAIEPKREPRAKYPRVSARKGKAPEQYRSDW